MHHDAQAALRVAIATERRREVVRGVHLLYALLRDGEGPAAAMLARYGTSAGVLNEPLERAL